jgi:hypothetical protein
MTHLGSLEILEALEALAVLGFIYLFFESKFISRSVYSRSTEADT